MNELGTVKAAPHPDRRFDDSEFDSKKFKQYWEERLKFFRGGEIKELGYFLQELKKFPFHNYNTIVDAVIVAMRATFKYMDEGENGGITGFQASCIGGAIHEEMAMIERPYRIVQYKDLLYPQYVKEFPIKTIPKEIADWLREEATKLLGTDPKAHPDVKAHWERLAAGSLPEDIVWEVVETPNAANN